MDADMHYNEESGGRDVGGQDQHNGRENVNSVLISRTATAALKAVYPSHSN